MSLSTLSGFARSSASNSVLDEPDTAPCQEWQEILDKYRMAARAHSEAVAALTYVPGAGFAEAWLRAERSRKACDACRDELLDHEHSHACLVPGRRH
jgi:hypothetical protein